MERERIVLGEKRKMIRNMKLGQKLIALFMIMSLIIALTGAFGIWSLNEVGGKVQGLLKERSSQQKLVLMIKLSVEESRTLVYKAALAENNETFDNIREACQSKLAFIRNFYDIMLNGNKTVGIPALAKGSELEGKVLALQSDLDSLENIVEQLFSHKAALLKSNTSTDQELQRLRDIEVEKTIDGLSEKMNDLVGSVEVMVDNANSDALRIRRNARIALIAVIISGTVLALLFGAAITRTIVTRINKMASALAKGAMGDLTVKLHVDSGDEIGVLSDNYNTMVEKLSEMVGKVMKAVEGLGRVADDIKGVSNQSLSVAKSQADDIFSASSSIVKIDALINDVAKDMGQLSASAEESSSSTMEMAANLTQVSSNMDTLGLSVEEVSSSITQMAASLKNIDESVVKMVDVSAITAGSVDEMTAAIREVKQCTLLNETMSNELMLDAEEGKRSVEATIAGMKEIKRSSDITSDVISTLSERTGEIGKILSVIEEVAEQTNLLALNAAIIAAQVGEHGKGFAVVAGEIKELAVRTKVSTSEIATVIKGVQNEVFRALESIGQAEKNIADGETLSIKSGKALEKMVSCVNKSREQMIRIAGASEEQSKQSEVMGKAMDQLSDLIAGVARATSEQGTGSDLIMKAVEQMKVLTGELRHATREQSKMGMVIGESTANITTLICKINSACEEQSRGSSHVVESVEGIKRTTEISIESVKVMDDSAKILLVHSGLLHKEIGQFLIDSPPEVVEVTV